MQSLKVTVDFYLDSSENEACLSSLFALLSLVTVRLWVNFKQIRQMQVFLYA